MFDLSFSSSSTTRKSFAFSRVSRFVVDGSEAGAATILHPKPFVLFGSYRQRTSDNEACFDDVGALVNFVASGIVWYKGANPYIVFPSI